MAQSYYSRHAYSGYKPKTIGGTSLWAPSEVGPDLVASFVNRQSSVLCIVGRIQCSYLQVFGHAAGRFTLTATLITSGYAIILTTMGGPTSDF